MNQKEIDKQLHIALWQNKFTIAQNYINNGANVNSIYPNDVNISNLLVENTTPLTDAVSKSKLNTIMFLLKNKANVNIEDGEGLSPLYKCLKKLDRKGDIKIMQLLKANGALPLKEGIQENECIAMLNGLLTKYKYPLLLLAIENESKEIKSKINLLLKNITNEASIVLSQYNSWRFIFDPIIIKAKKAARFSQQYVNGILKVLKYSI
jgi:hypothetical protein